MQATVLNLNNSYPSVENVRVGYFYEQLENAANKAGLTFYRIQFLSGIPSGEFSSWKIGRRAPSDKSLEKLSSVDELGVTLSELKAWKVLDQVETPEDAEVLLKAIKEAQKKWE